MSFIYLITSLEKDCVIDDCEKIYKIGVSKHELTRLKQLQTGSSKKLKIVKTFKSEFPYKVESNLHAFFKHKHEEGEWFRLNNSDLERFEGLCEQYEKNFKFLINQEFYQKQFN